MNINITLKPSIIRDSCIEHNFYTCGDNEEYEAMFQQAREENNQIGVLMFFIQNSKIWMKQKYSVSKQEEDWSDIHSEKMKEDLC